MQQSKQSPWEKIVAKIPPNTMFLQFFNYSEFFENNPDENPQIG